MAKTIKRKELIDDYIRNFFISNNLPKSLEAFQAEWYNIAQRGKIEGEEERNIPDVELKNMKMMEKTKGLKNELRDANEYAEKTRDTWD